MPPIPDGEPPLEEGPLEGGGDGGEALFDGVFRYAKMAREKASGQKYRSGRPLKPVHLKPPFSQRTPNSGDLDVLAKGATEFILELVRRFPRRARDQELLKWFSSAHRLGRAIDALKLWRFLMQAPMGHPLDAVGESLWKGVKATRTQHLRGGRWAILAVFGGPNLLSVWYPELLEEFRRLGWPSGDFRDFLDMLWRYPPAWGQSDWSSIATDPVDDLGGWPIPRDIAKSVDAPNPDYTSAYEFLALVIGTPGLLSSDKVGRRTVAMLVFAAAHLTVRSTPVLASAYFGDRLAHAALSHAANVALVWLGEQFPTRIFPGPVEDLIRGASELVYA